MLFKIICYYYSLQAAVWLYCLAWRKRRLSLVLRKYLHPSKSTWAVISGASDGIGLGFAKVLRERGWSVMLLGRNEAKLQQVKESLCWEEEGKVEYFVCEAGMEAEQLTARLRELKAQLEDKDVGLLVNNVGMTEGVFGWFGDQDKDWPTEKSEAEDATKTIRVNCVFPSKLTHCLLPLLQKRLQPSGIINLSSVLAWTPCPFNPIYGATKAFNRAFSRALTAEYAQLGIDVLCVSPGLVQSQLTGLGEGSVMGATAVSTAEGALSALGVEVECFPHWMHGVTGAAGMAMAWVPTRMASILTAVMLRFLPKPPGINVSKDLRVR